jgi:DNA recombination protein RmuC
MNAMVAVFLVLLVLGDAMLAVLLAHTFGTKQQDRTDELEDWVDERLAKQGEEYAKKLRESQSVLADQTYTAVRGVSETLQTSVQGMSNMLSANQTAQQRMMERRLQTLEVNNEQKLENMRKTLADGMETMRADNGRKLDEIRHTVDEQLQDTLQKRINESFKAVNEQLEQVYKGLGEMQNLASDVGGLKQVLSGVKTRGILGEIQLGAILEEILAPEQYATNINTIPGSTQRVEYAVRMPGADGDTVWLPIDSKFPGDTYAHLQDAYASGDAEAVAAARRALETVLRAEAKDIRTKYVEPPYTTNFGILFLPFEGLYAEVVNAGMLEVLQREYQVNVAGPSTMAALLNSLQMGFKTLAIQKRSSEVWQVLGAVKTEFEKFGDGLSKMQQHLRQTDEDLDRLIGTRTRAINRKLRQVQTLDGSTAAALLELDAEEPESARPALPENTPEDTDAGASEWD